MESLDCGPRGLIGSGAARPGAACVGGSPGDEVALLVADGGDDDRVPGIGDTWAAMTSEHQAGEVGDFGGFREVFPSSVERV